MTHFLSSCIKSAFICEKKWFPKSLKYFIFKSSIHLQSMRYVKASQSQISSNKICLYKYWSQEHNKHSDIFKGLLKRDRNIECYVSDEVIKMFCSTFNMDINECKSIVKQKQFESFSTSHLIEMAHFLKEKGVTTEHLIRAPWLLWMKKEEMSTKLSLITQPHLFKNELDGLSFTIFQPSLISKYKEKFVYERNDFEQHQNRIYYMGYELKLPIDLLTLKLILAWRILHLRREKIDAVITVLLEFKIEPMEIINDIWVFLCNVEKLDYRLRKMREVSGVLPIKLWVCNCSDYIFQKAFERHERKLFKRTLTEILKEELDLNEEEIPQFVVKGRLDEIQPNNIEHKFQVYKKAQMDLDIIRTFPRLLIYSENRILERLKILKEKNIVAIPPKILIASEEQFKAYLESD